jgi:hypothetical protein
MTAATERDGELVADLAAERSVLGEAQVVRVGRLSATDEAGISSSAKRTATAGISRYG